MTPIQKINITDVDTMIAEKENNLKKERIAKMIAYSLFKFSKGFRICEGINEASKLVSKYCKILPFFKKIVGV